MKHEHLAAGGGIDHHAPAAPRSRRAIRLGVYALLALGDLISLIAAFAVGNLLRFGAITEPSGLVSLAVMLPIYFGVVVQRKPYSGRFFVNWRRAARDAVTADFTATVVASMMASHFHAELDVARSTIILGGVIVAPLLIGTRWALKVGSTSILNGQPVSTVIIRDGADLSAPGDIPVVDAALIGLTPSQQDPGTFALLSAVIGSAERVVVACPPDRRRAWAALLKGANVMGEIVIPEFDELGTIRTSTIGGTSTAVTSIGPLDTTNRAIKRAFDLCVATVALTLLAPLLVIVAIAVRLDSRGPVLFRQPRMGRGNALFEVLKFRSMRTSQCDTAGDRSTIRGDSRVTRVGRVIRATSIDELPQLFNVLRGDMSIVGPRPHALGSLAGDKLFWEVDERYWDRHAMKPGITGLAQVHGYRGATAVPADLANRLRADIAYMRGWSIWRDVRIMIVTLGVVVHRNAF